MEQNNEQKNPLHKDFGIFSNIKYILLSHLSKESNTPEIAFRTVKARLEENGVYIGNDVMVDMTYRDKSTHVYSLI